MHVDQLKLEVLIHSSEESLNNLDDKVDSFENRNNLNYSQVF